MKISSPHSINQYVKVFTFALSLFLQSLNINAQDRCCDGTFEVILTDNSTSSMYGTLIQNANVLLEGTFIVDDVFAFENCNITCCPGSIIIVEPDITLVLQGTTTTTGGNDFHGCNNMWRGIRLSADNSTSSLGGSIKVISGDNIIRDAEYGIDAELLNNVEFTSPVATLFNSNYIGIRAVTTAKVKLGAVEFNSTYPLLAPYSGQTTTIGASSYAGLYISNDMNWDFALYSGTKTFQNINIGIHARGCNLNISGLPLYRAYFENIRRDAAYPLDDINGSAIYARRVGGWFGNLHYNGKGNLYNIPEIYECDRAIHTRDIQVKLDGIFASQVIDGFKIVGGNVNNKNIDITFCQLETEHNGIQLLRNDPSNHILVSHNEINFGQTSSSTGAFSGIAVIENGNPNPDCVIGDDNFIAFNSSNNQRARYGIRLLNTANWLVVNNRVEIDNNDAAKYGISIENSEFANVNCNTIECPTCLTNAPTGFNQTQNHVGIYNYNGSDFTISCNNTDYTSYGISNRGVVGGINQLRTNTMGSHHHGLFLQAQSIIGPQNGAGNEWINSSLGLNGRQAKAVGGVSILLNEFRVNTSISCGDFPNPVQPNIGWFMTSSQVSNSCCNYTFCGIPDFVNDEVDSLDWLLVSDTSENEPYTEETVWQLSRNLYKRLVKYPELIETGHEFEDFYNYHYETNIGAFERVDRENFTQVILDQGLIVDLLEKTDVINALLIEINEIQSGLHNDTLLDSLEIVDIQFTILGLYEELRSYTDDYSNLYAEFENERRVIAELFYENNNLIETENIYEENKKLVNEIYYSTVTDEDLSYTYAQLETLSSIANQCPFSGGIAVFEAGAKLIYNDNDYENDFTTECDTALDSRVAEIFNNETNIDFIIYPNPATEIVRIELNRDVTDVKILRIELTDVLGVSRYEDEISSGIFDHILQTGFLSNGLYSIKIYNKQDRNNYTLKKLIISK